MRHSAFRNLTLFLACAAAVLGAATVPARAQNREVPYWAALDDELVYMRSGPNERFPIEWVYRRQGLPVKVVRLMQGWRLVQDPDGAQGWILSPLLTSERHAVVIGEEVTALRELPDAQSALRWNVEPGVVGKLGECRDGWCQIDIGGRSGWILQDHLWGADEL